MTDSVIRPSSEVEPVTLPLTAICIVADKQRVPRGFSPITKCFDDGSDADMWRDSMFSFQRQFRYLCISRELPDSNIRAPVSVITDITIVKEADPIPHGFIALDYTADSREKSLRKKFICVKSEHRDRVVDAVGDVIVTAKLKKTPKDYTYAGEVDGLSIYFKAIAIPATYNLQHSSSASQLNRQSGLYPGLPTTSTGPSSVPSDLSGAAKVDVFTIKNPMIQKPKGVDGVPFKLNSHFEASLGNKRVDNLPPLPNFDIRRLDSEEFSYSFALERATLAN